MVPSMTTVLGRFTGEWAALLQPEDILSICEGCVNFRATMVGR
jgi:hypothetical protein